MKITVKRIALTDKSTIGKLSVDGRPHCYTLEDAVRELGVKVHGKTAIPAGTYNVTITMSNRFKKLMPLLHDVPGFAGVRIHKGNTAENTEGCLLVGMAKSRDRISDCASAYDPLFNAIDGALKDGQKVTITIT